MHFNVVLKIISTVSIKRNTRVCRPSALVFLALIFVSVSAVAKHKDDVVVLHNGDRMTGEIKSLEQGVLSFKADYMSDSVRLDWKRVARIESKDQYIIILINGRLYTGTLDLVSRSRGVVENVEIRAGNDTVKVKQDEVLTLRPSEAGFLKQLKGTIDYGFGYTSGNSQYQSQLSAGASYRRMGHYFTGNLSSTLSGQSEGERTSRYNVNVGYRRLFREKWFAGTFLDFLNSEQQSLELRTTTGGILGRTVLQTDTTAFSLGAGMVFTRERYDPSSGREPRASNAEAVVGLDFYTVRFKTTDITFQITHLPERYCARPNEIGVELRIFRIELVKNLYWSFNLYENFDNKPPVDVKRNDLGVSTSFGWKF